MSEKSEKSRKKTMKEELTGLKKSDSEERMDQWLAEYFADDEDVIIIESKCIPATRPLPETDYIVISD